MQLDVCGRRRTSRELNKKKKSPSPSGLIVFVLSLGVDLDDDVCGLECIGNGSKLNNCTDKIVLFLKLNNGNTHKLPVLMQL